MRSLPASCVKICGITNVDDAVFAADAGADWLGLNFIETSPRAIALKEATDIAKAVSHRCSLVGVVADFDLSTLRRLLSEVPLDFVQLHGDESPEVVQSLQPNAFKALRMGCREDVTRAIAEPGPLVLCDAYVPGKLGGTGETIQARFVEPAIRSRRVLLAGGLGPANVAEMIATLRPWGVDVASGVEAGPRTKDRQKVAVFIALARNAFRALAEGCQDPGHT